MHGDFQLVKFNMHEIRMQLDVVSNLFAHDSFSLIELPECLLLPGRSNS